jgi:restriction system protein
MEITYHYPPDLMGLLIEAIPALCKSKRDVVLFFRGAGVGESYIGDIARQLANNRDSIRKHEIVRTVLARLNEKGEAALRERREVLRRVTEFENFSMCWDNDRHKAIALVAQIRQLVNVKDSFTRMRDEEERGRRIRQAEADAKARELQKRTKELEQIKTDLFSLFAMTDPWKRGKALESVLNRLFEAHGILVRQAFNVKGNEGQGIIEQIDGVVQLDGDLYLVEMKWWNKPLGRGEVSEHLVRAFHRADTRAIFIAYPSFTAAAVDVCKDALHLKVVVLCELEELVHLLEKNESLTPFLKRKVQAAQIDKQPLFKV